MTSLVDRNNPLPLYHQLEQVLLDDIARRDLKPGDRLPSEKEIERHFGVSRATIRRSLDSLVQDGVIERIQGKGTFVAHPRIRHASRLISFTEDMRSQGLSPSHQVLESTFREAPPDIAERLALGDRTPVWYLHRLHLADGEPVGLGNTWVPVDALGSAATALRRSDVDIESLYSFLESDEVGVDLHHGVESVTAGNAREPAAKLLRCPVGSPLLRVERVTFATSGRPVEVTRFAFVAERYEYRTEIVR